MKTPSANPHQTQLPDWKHLREEHRNQLATLETRLNAGRRDGKHPVWDFLTTYYSFPLPQLRRWSPGISGTAIGSREEISEEFAERRFFTIEPLGDGQARAFPDAAQFPAHRREGLRRTIQLLQATAARSPSFGCFGLHEWAMVYGLRQDEIRHMQVPLRLPPGEIAEIVERGPIRCTHWDAFRFFTPAARPLNQLQPDPETRAALEQPGCLHANMDLYKWAYKYAPWTSSTLILDCLELAMDIRELDMRASPYDLRAFGFDPVKIETVEGRKTYEQSQRQFTQRAAPLRRRVITELLQLEQAVGEAEAEVALSLH